MELDADYRVLSFASARARLADAPHHFRGEEPLDRPGPPLVRFLPLRTPLRRVPRVAGTAFAASEGEGRQTPTGAVLRVLAPLDGSGCVRGTHGPLRGPPVRRDAPTLRGLLSCRSRSLEPPYRAFPSRGAVPALAGRFFLAGSCRPPPTRHTRELRGRFPHPAGPLAVRGPGAPGRLPGREGAFPRSLRSDNAALLRRRPPDRSLACRDSPVDAAVTPASKLCSPRESVRATVPPWPGGTRRPVLSWALVSPPEPAPERSWIRFLAFDSVPGWAWSLPIRELDASPM